MSEIAITYDKAIADHPKEVEKLILLARKGNSKNRFSDPKTWTWGYAWNKIPASKSSSIVMMSIDERLTCLPPLIGMSIFALLPSGHVQRCLPLPESYVVNPPDLVINWYRTLFEIERAAACIDSQDIREV